MSGTAVGCSAPRMQTICHQIPFLLKLIWASITVGTKIIADLETFLGILISEKLQFLLRDRPCLELIIFCSNFQALLFAQDRLLKSV